MFNTRTLDNSQDIIDSRQVDERIEELKSDIVDAFTDLESEEDPPEFDDLFPRFGDDANETEGYIRECGNKDVETEAEELLALVQFADEAQCSDWSYGETLIRESYFSDYARDLADDIAPSVEARELANTWPFNRIDWEAAANDLRMDYSSAEFDGVTYLFRS